MGRFLSPSGEKNNASGAYTERKGERRRGKGAIGGNIDAAAAGHISQRTVGEVKIVSIESLFSSSGTKETLGAVVVGSITWGGHRTRPSGLLELRHNTLLKNTRPRGNRKHSRGGDIRVESAAKQAAINVLRHPHQKAYNRCRPPYSHRSPRGNCSIADFILFSRLCLFMLDHARTCLFVLEHARTLR